MGKLLSFRGSVGAGKTFASKHLVDNHGFTKVSFADALKEEVFSMLWTGMHEGLTAYQSYIKELGRDLRLIGGWELTDKGEQVLPRSDSDFPGFDLYYVSTEEKLKWVNDHKGALRELLRFHGTEYRRGQDENYWLKQWEIKVRQLLSEGKNVVVDDARFENELFLIKSLGGIHIFLDSRSEVREARLEKRDGTGVAVHITHASEALSNNPTSWDTMVINSEDEANFIQNVDNCLLQVPNVTI